MAYSIPNMDIWLFANQFMRFVLALWGWLIFLSCPAFCQTDTAQVYYLRGCERCNQTEKFLNDHKIPHKTHFIDIQDDYKKLVKVMDGVGFKNGQTLSFPVVVVKGQTHFNIPVLDAFLKSLSQVN